MGTIAVDFDGVIHTYSRGWGDGSIYDEPMPGALDGLRTLMKRHAVFVHTSREPESVAAWLDERGVPTVTETDGGTLACEFWSRQDIVLVTNRKLPALAYIDDRGIRFESWPQALAVVEEVLGRA